jgi:hypothetical protein
VLITNSPPSFDCLTALSYTNSKRGDHHLVLQDGDLDESLVVESSRTDVVHGPREYKDPFANPQSGRVHRGEGEVRLRYSLKSHQLCLAQAPGPSTPLFVSSSSVPRIIKQNKEAYRRSQARFRADRGDEVERRWREV